MSNGADQNKLLLVIIAILLSPLAVFLKEGAGTQFIINLVLYLLCVSWPIALVHAIYIVLK